MIRDVLADLRFAGRTLRRSPVFAVVSVTVLALAIGANSAVFSFMDALLLKTMTVAEPDRLVSLGPGAHSIFGMSDSPQAESFSYQQFEALQELEGVFTRIAASPTFGGRVTVGEPVSPDNIQRASCQLVTGEYFGMLGVRPILGRPIEPEDDEAGSSGARVAVLSYSYWQRRRGGDPGIVGTTIRLQGEPFTVIGVAPESFTGHHVEAPADMWAPLSQHPLLMGRDSLFVEENYRMAYWLNILGRLAPGVTVRQAQDAVNRVVVLTHEANGGGELRDFWVEVAPVGRGISSLRDRLTRPLTLLWAGTGLLLLIACANLANLLLARAADRRREVGVRVALGAGSLRLFRQLIAESVLLAAAGVAVGIAVAAWLVPAMTAMIGEMRGGSGISVTLDWRVTAFASALGLFTVLLFGSAPAWWSLRSGIASAMAGGRGTSGGTQAQARTKNLLIGAQVALSLVLLASTGLLLRTLGELRGVDLGVEPENVLLFSMDPSGAAPDGQDALRRAILSEVEGMPGIQAAAFAEDAPFNGNFSSSTIEVEGYDATPNEDVNILIFRATPGYFDVMAVPLVAGRLFNEADPHDQTCLVSEAFAARYFPNGDAVGGVLGRSNDRLRILGVVGDVRHVDIREGPPPMIYHSALGYERVQDTLLFRVRGDGAAESSAVRAAVRNLAPSLPISRTPSRVMEILDRAAALERLLGKLTGAFAALALLLAALGVYGVFSYGVARRTGELGLRQALGADRGALIALVMRQAVVVLAAGSAVGLVGAVFAGRLLSGILFGVSAYDPAALGVSLATLLGAGLLAAYWPARRAAAVSPAEALRHD